MRSPRAAAIAASLLLLGLGVDAATAAKGLKEALRVGAKSAVALVSKPDGFLGNPEIRIPLPGAMKDMARGLKRIGFASQLDEFERSMNRAAESAAGEALDVFGKAIAEMSISDARGILAGGPTAATDYLKGTTSDELRARFSPIVEKSMARTGVVAIYDRLMQHWKALPLAARPNLDLDQYVTQKTLDGLFLMIGKEEGRIRSDPKARASDLLKRVFGSR